MRAQGHSEELSESSRVSVLSLSRMLAVYSGVFHSL